MDRALYVFEGQGFAANRGVQMGYIRKLPEMLLVNRFASFNERAVEETG